MITTVTKTHAFASHKYSTNHLKIGNNEFIVSGTECFVTDLEDYSIVSDFDITEYLELEYTGGAGGIGSGNNNNGKSSTGQKRKRDDSFDDVAVFDSLRCIPREIRSKQNDRWINVAHIQIFSRSIITRDRLRDRVCSGQILAYHYKECSIEGNKCIYYGFVPTLNFKSLQPNDDDDDRIEDYDDDDNDSGSMAKSGGNDGGKSELDEISNNDANSTKQQRTNSNVDNAMDEEGERRRRRRLKTIDTNVDAGADEMKKMSNVKSFYGAHVTAKINVQHVWPRKLYIQLKRDSACSCSNGCLRVSVLTIDDVHATITDARKIIKPKRTYCLKRVPWNRVYIMMGDIDKTVIESIKEHRMCKTCAQCRKCLNSPVFCRDHKRCKHEKTMVDVSSFDLSLGMPKIKKCRKII